MKKVVSFLVILAALVAGVVYYTGETPTTATTETAIVYRLPSEVKIQHPGWTGSLVSLPNNRAQRKGHSDAGKIQNVTLDSFEIVWDQWDIEVYKKNPKTGIYHLFDKKQKTQAAVAK